jgi:hypothetical protein
MTRDSNMERIVAGNLGHLSQIDERVMFGGLCWMWRGNLLCGARHDGILARLGKGYDAWAVATPGISAMMMGERRMEGWVRLSTDAAGDEVLRKRLLKAAEQFVATLPSK